MKEDMSQGTDVREVLTVISIRSRIRKVVAEAWASATTAGTLPAVEDAERPDVEIERPAKPEHGDLATNLAMKLARPMRQSPLQIAEALAEAMRTVAGGTMLSQVDVAAPGFINMRLEAAWLERVLAEASAAGEAFGHVDDESMRAVRGGMGALDRGVVSIGEGDKGLFASTAGLLADPLMASTGSVEAIGAEGIAEGADGAAVIIIAAQDPEVLVPIGGMSAEVDQAAGMKVMIDGVQDDVIAKASIPGHGIHM